MRAHEEILEMVKNPGKFMPYDVYQSGIIELYPFVEFSELPEMIAERIPEEARNTWNPQEERDHFDLSSIVQEESEFLLKLIDNMEDVAAVYRFPRLLANLWLADELLSSYVTRYKELSRPGASRTESRRDMRRLIRDIRKSIIK